LSPHKDNRLSDAARARESLCRPHRRRVRAAD